MKQNCKTPSKIFDIWCKNARQRCGSFKKNSSIMSHNGVSQLEERKKKDMVSTIYHNNQKEATRKIIYQISSTVLEIKKLCSYFLCYSSFRITVNDRVLWPLARAVRINYILSIHSQFQSLRVPQSSNMCQLILLTTNL